MEMSDKERLRRIIGAILDDLKIYINGLLADESGVPSKDIFDSKPEFQSMLNLKFLSVALVLEEHIDYIYKEFPKYKDLIEIVMNAKENNARLFKSKKVK
jgi:hypothetical protein